jgi:hypothetical protein
MRNLMNFAILLALVAGLSSCEKIKSLFDVDFDTTFSGDLDIDIPESALKSAIGYEFQVQATIDPLDDEDVAEYIDNIKEMQVNDVLATVVAVNKENVAFESGTFFKIADDTDVVTWTLTSDWPITEGTELTLGDLGGTYKVVQDILERKGPFKIGVEGTCTQKGVNITIRLSIDTKVIASPL